MLRKQTKKRKNIFSIPVTNIIGLLISSLIGVISVSIISFIISIVLTKASSFPLYTEVYFCGCVGIGALISGFISAKKCSFKGFISGFICSFITIFFITTIMLFFTNGKLSENTLIMFLVIIICSTIGGIFSANTKKR